MNVLYLTMNPNRASTTVPTEGWFRLLPSRGLRPVLVSAQLGAFHEWATEQGIPAYHVPLEPPSKVRLWRFLRSLWSLRQIVRRHQIELVHCNEQDIYPIGRYLARLCRLPVMVSVHFTMGRGFCNWAFRRPYQPQRVFFVSGGNREACRNGMTGVVPEIDWRVLHNGLDLNHFRPDPDRRARFRAAHGLTKGPVIGVACALRKRKQVEHLFEAAERVDVPGLKVVLAGGPVAGEPDGYADRLLAEGRARLGDRFVYLGHLTELRDFYNGLDLFVNTSSEEACSISVLESLACSCPVVGYPSKSVDEQVLPDGGEIVEQDRVDLLAGALYRWVGDPARLAQGRASARHRVEECYDIRSLADQLWDEYQEVVAVRPRPPVRIPVPAEGRS